MENFTKNEEKNILIISKTEKSLNENQKCCKFCFARLKKTISKVKQIRIINIQSSDVLQMEIESSSTFVEHEKDFFSSLLFVYDCQANSTFTVSRESTKTFENSKYKIESFQTQNKKSI